MSAIRELAFSSSLSSFARVLIFLRLRRRQVQVQVQDSSAIPAHDAHIGQKNELKPGELAPSSNKTDTYKSSRKSNRSGLNLKRREPAFSSFIRNYSESSISTNMPSLRESPDSPLRRQGSNAFGAFVLKFNPEVKVVPYYGLADLIRLPQLLPTQPSS